MQSDSTGSLGKLLPEKHILTADELAPVFRVDERTIRRMAERWRDTGGLEGLPAIKIGRQWRFVRDQIHTYLTRTL